MSRTSEVGIVVAVFVSVIVFGIAYLYASTSLSIRSELLQSMQTSGSGSGSSTVVAVSLQQELNNSSNFRFTLNASDFASNSASGCSLQQISPCDNNEPSQFICVNSYYAGLVQKQKSGMTAPSGLVCPDFMMAGTLSCTVQYGYCVVTSTT